MSPRLSCTLVLLLLLTLPGAAATLPVALPAGSLEKLERLAGSEAELAWIAPAALFRQAAAAGSTALLEAGTEVPREAIEKRPVDDGKAYILLEIALAAGRTLSPLDYLLVADGDSAAALGLAPAETRTIDFRLLKATGPARVLLVFACPATATQGVLRSAFGLPLPDVTLTLQEPPPPETPPPAETPATAAPTATTPTETPATAAPTAAEPSL